MINTSFATAKDDPISDRAGDKTVDLEEFQDTRTKPNSTIPISDKETESNLGAHNALSNCLLG